MNLDLVERPLVLYHDPCVTSDGWCAAFLAALRFPGAELIPTNYTPAVWLGSGRFEIEVTGDKRGRREFDFFGRDVLILDLSYGPETLKAMHRAARSLLVLDHHKTARDNCVGLDFCIFDMQRSGAGLALDTFFPGSRERARQVQDNTYTPRAIATVGGQQLPWPDGLKNVAALWVTDLALTIEDYDLWRFSRPNTRAIGLYLQTIEKTIGAWSHLPSPHDMAIAGTAMMSLRSQLVDSLARNAYPVSWPEGKILVVNSAILTNEIADALKEKALQLDPLGTVLVWYRAEDGTVRCSLRSHHDGADVSSLAKPRGGGGHERSAGFTVPNDLQIARHLMTADQ